MPEGFSELPAALQTLATMAAVIVGGAIAVLSTSKRILNKFFPEKEKKTETTTDAVVVSAAFADSKPMRELTEIITKLDETISDVNHNMKLQGRIQNDATLELIAEVMKLTAAMRRNQ